MNLFYLHKSLFIIPVLLTGIILFTGCDDSPPVEQKKFVKVYTDIIIAQDTVAVDSIDSAKIKDDVFKRYNITSTDYNNMLEYLNKKPERWEKFFDEAINYVEELKENHSP